MVRPTAPHIPSGRLRDYQSEKEQSFAVIARAIEEYCAKHLKREYTSCKHLLTMSDSHGSYRNTYTKLAQAKDTPFSPETTTIGMCYFHVKQGKGLTGKVDGRKEHSEDLDVLAYVPSGYTKLWRNLFDLFTDKWLRRKVRRLRKQRSL